MGILDDVFTETRRWDDDVATWTCPDEASSDEAVGTFEELADTSILPQVGVSSAYQVVERDVESCVLVSIAKLWSTVWAEPIANGHLALLLGLKA